MWISGYWCYTLGYAVSNNYVFSIFEYNSRYSGIFLTNKMSIYNNYISVVLIRWCVLEGGF